MIHNILLGAFGEVRKAIHKITGQQRAIKMIKKKLAKQEELDKLINEVNMLKKLVFNLIVLLGSSKYNKSL